MYLETTIKIDPYVKECILFFAKNTDLSMSFIIKFFLKRLDEKCIRKDIIYGLIKYQSHRPVNGYDDFHFTLTNDEKNCFEMMRIRYKKSISFLVFIGFLLFFKELINQYQKDKNGSILDSYSSIILIPVTFNENNKITREDDP